MERLDLNFRAEPARQPSSGLWPGWWLWCMLALAAGYGMWWASRHYLARRLSDQLATAQNPSEAFLALEGLLMLDSTATLEIARGLQHPNPQVARTAYRTLDAQISGWSQLEASIAAARMRTLSQRLRELPEATPPDNLVLASSLASRIFSICLDLNDPQLASVMTNCEVVFQRVGQVSRGESGTLAASPSTVEADKTNNSDLDRLGQRVQVQANALRPPPPLQKPADNQYTLSEQTSVSTIAPRDVLHSSSSAPTAKVQFLTAATRPRAESHGRISASLSDDSPSEFSLSDSNAETSSPQPAVVHGPASVASQPLAEMRQLKVDVELENIQQLDIDQLVRLLASVQPQVAQSAALALRAKEFPDDRLALASELGSSNATHRIEMLQAIATRSDLDPRPWLMWMAEDGELEVRLQAVGLLSSMIQDHTVQSDLRRLLSQERDEPVAQAIRRVLLARTAASR